MIRGNVGRWGSHRAGALACRVASAPRRPAPPYGSAILAAKGLPLPFREDRRGLHTKIVGHCCTGDRRGQVVAGGASLERPLTLPVVQIVEDTLPLAWEKAVLATWEQGAQIETQYDKPGDPPSRDASLFLTVRDAFAEPRIHRAFPAGIEELEVYRQEVVDGIHDHWIDPEAGKWEYTYHERICRFTTPGGEPVDQLAYIRDALCQAPHTRRAQAVLWKPWEDAGIEDPACLQRLWFRIYGDELVLNAHMRSNDAFKAAFMNMYAFTDLQRVVAERVSDGLGR